MNFGENESFFERHRYLFQHCYFQFEGLEPDIQIRFENIIKRLSGVICKDPDYILTQKSYFNRECNKSREDLYSVNYILDSIRAKQALDINSYRFKPEKVYQSIDPCCLFSKYILKTGSCKRYYYDNLCSSDVDNDLSEFVSMAIENEDTTSSRSPNILKDNRKQNENAETLKIQLVNGTKTPEITKKVRKILQFENNEQQIKKHKSIDNDFFSKTSISNSNGTNSKFKEIRISDWKKKVHTPNNDSFCKSLDSKNICNYCNMPNKTVSRKRVSRNSLDKDSPVKDENRKITRKFRKLCPKSTDISIVDLEIDDESSESSGDSLGLTSEEEEEEEDEVEIDENNINEWWSYLPPANRLSSNAKAANRNTRRGANFTEREQKLMLSYLITKRKVAVGASRITWKEIHEDGYLKNRSTESLRNNFRRVILPKIHTFGLPQHILQQFLKLN